MPDIISSDAVAADAVFLEEGADQFVEAASQRGRIPPPG